MIISIDLRRPDNLGRGGPGSLTKTLGITGARTRFSLLNGRIWTKDQGINVDHDSLVVGERVDTDNVGVDALRPDLFRADPCRCESLNQ